MRTMRTRPRCISAGNIAASLTDEPARAVGTLRGDRHASADQRPSEVKFNDFQDNISPNGHPGDVPVLSHQAAILVFVGQFAWSGGPTG